MADDDQQLSFIQLATLTRNILWWLNEKREPHEQTKDRQNERHSDKADGEAPSCKFACAV